jgi:hypothetical protein
VRSGKASRIITDGSETLRLGNLEFEVRVVAGTRKTADRVGVSKD